MLKKLVLFLLLLTVFIYITNPTGNYLSIPTENSKPVEVYFCPQDDCAGVFADVVYSSNESVFCAFYDVDLPEVVSALDSVGAELVTDENRALSGLMHNKFCIIDEKIVLTGSYNPTESGVRNNNNLLVIHSVYLSENYLDEFEELRNGEFGLGKNVKYPAINFNGNRMENYFCPEDNCASRIIETINSAQESIYFMAFSFTLDEIGDLLIEKHNQGVSVKGVFEKFGNSRYSEYEKLREAGIDAVWDKNPKNMHHKVFIIDNKTVITGSTNPTKAGTSKNDENVLIIHNRVIADKYLGEFNRLYHE